MSGWHARTHPFHYFQLLSCCLPRLPWVFPDISLRKFQNSMRNTFPSMRLLGSQGVVLALLSSGEVCNIHESHYNQSVNECNLDTWHKTHIPQTGENLSLLGYCPKFPEFSLILFPNSLSFPWLVNWKLIFKVFPDFQSGWEPCPSFILYILVLPESAVATRFTSRSVQHATAWTTCTTVTWLMCASQKTRRRQKQRR